MQGNQDTISRRGCNYTGHNASMDKLESLNFEEDSAPEEITLPTLGTPHSFYFEYHVADEKDARQKKSYWSRRTI